jgi:hypothetical protein
MLWTMTYLGTSQVIPLYNDVINELEKYPDGMQGKLVKEKGNYRVFKTMSVKMPFPFNGIAYLSAAYLNGVRVNYIE